MGRGFYKASAARDPNVHVVPILVECRHPQFRVEERRFQGSRLRLALKGRLKDDPDNHPRGPDYFYMTLRP